MKSEPDWFCRGLAFLALAQTGDGLLSDMSYVLVVLHWIVGAVDWFFEKRGLA